MYKPDLLRFAVSASAPPDDRQKTAMDKSAFAPTLTPVIDPAEPRLDRGAASAEDQPSCT